jgi:hypothetical protein
MSIGDQNFHVDADPHADPTQGTPYWKITIFYILIVTALPIYNVLSFSSVYQLCQNFQYFERLIEI